MATDLIFLLLGVSSVQAVPMEILQHVQCKDHGLVFLLLFSYFFANSAHVLSEVSTVLYK